jgi:hypothetical protein
VFNGCQVNTAVVSIPRLCKCLKHINRNLIFISVFQANAQRPMNYLILLARVRNNVIIGCCANCNSG